LKRPAEVGHGARQYDRPPCDLCPDNRKPVLVRKFLDLPDVCLYLGALLDSPEKRRSLGKAGRARAVNVFSWEAVAAQTVRVYERAIARKAAQGES
jgi:hypothetical protein